MLTIYKCSGKNRQWTTSVEDTVYRYTSLLHYKIYKNNNNIVKVIQKRIKQPTGIYFTAKANQIEGENTPSRLK